jgi:hypothetical protein
MIRLVMLIKLLAEEKFTVDMAGWNYLLNKMIRLVIKTCLTGGGNYFA